MLSNQITTIAGKNKTSQRLGRGQASKGKTCGRGHKGNGSRPGSNPAAMHEGGQMPLFRRLPKRGFNNYNFEKRYQIVNLSSLDRFEDGSKIDIALLVSAGLVDSMTKKIKILGDGEITKKFEIVAHKFSKSAEQKIIGSGGTAKVVA